ncbi:MAG: 3-methyl-2-oxobutanoate dehydrogenase subunit beta, partial [Oscillospiraceae bacterium]|nr:3-methyl-2-oxobutanoate dehydrogenase subunit beta [Oscillospiraceae bacterium]
LAGCDLPAVVVNIQRGGPGLGSIQPGQADYFAATKGGGHGDYHMIVLAPSTVQEMFNYTALAFALADQYRVTCMLLSDGILGQMMEPVDFSALSEYNREPGEKPWALTGTQGKRPPNIVNSLYIEPDVLERTVLERYGRYAEIERAETRWEERLTEDAEIVVVAYGAASRVAANAVKAAREEGIQAGLLRPITVWPYPKAPLAALAGRVKAFVCVELSMGQMAEDLELAIRCQKPVLRSTRTGGMVHSVEEIVAKIREANEG